MTGSDHRFIVTILIEGMVSGFINMFALASQYRPPKKHHHRSMINGATLNIKTVSIAQPQK